MINIDRIKKGMVVGGQPNILTLVATTVGINQTVTIAQLTPVGVNCTVIWGDGTANSTIANGYTGTTTHVYAAANAYKISINNAKSITQIKLNDAQLGSFNTGQLRNSQITYFNVTAITNSIIRSSDMSAWRPTTWYLSSMPTGTYNIASSDMSAWRPTNWYLYGMPTGTYNIASSDMHNWSITGNWELYNMPTGTYNIASSDMSAWRPTTWYLFSMLTGTYNIASSDMSAWRPTTWYLFSMPTGTYAINTSNFSAWSPTIFNAQSLIGSTWTITAADFATWVLCNSFRVDANSLTQAQVNATLQSLYAAFATRSVAGGTINVDGSNSTPSGTYQAETPPVTGKGYAYALVNDNMGINPSHKWTTVTIS